MTPCRNVTVSAGRFLLSWNFAIFRRPGRALFRPCGADCSLQPCGIRLNDLFNDNHKENGMTLYVNGTKVDEQEIENETQRLRPHHDQVFKDMPEEEREKQLNEWSRENVVEREILRQAAEEKNEPVQAHEIEKAYKELVDNHGGEDAFFKQTGFTSAGVPQIKKDIEKQIRFERFMEQVTADISEPAPDEIKKYYEENIQQFTIPEMVKASHIVKNVTPGSDVDEIRRELDALLAQIHKGASFEELADQHSECQDQGGDLGYFPRGQMVQEFEDVVFSLQVGQVSEVFQSPFGFHIAKVTDKKPACPAPLEQAKEKIVEHLKNEYRQQAIEVFVDARKKEAVIEER